MEASYAAAEIWRLHREGQDVVIEVHSRELDRWIELKLTRAQALTFVVEFARVTRD